MSFFFYYKCANGCTLLSMLFTYMQLLDSFYSTVININTYICPHHIVKHKTYS